MSYSTFFVDVFRKDSGDWITSLAEFDTELEAWAFARTCTPEWLQGIFCEDGDHFEVLVREAYVTEDGEVIFP